MALQTQNLWMLGLGVQGDNPPNPLQPAPLPDGAHLRWTFAQQVGFPWYGYYLFRRPSTGDRKKLCLSRWLRQYKAGPYPANQVTSGIGELSSDVPLTFTNLFPPSARVEVDLRDRHYLRLKPPANEPVRLVEATIGFTTDDEEESGSRTCVDFRKERPRPAPDPLTHSRARFTSFDHAGNQQAGRFWQLRGEVGWDTGFRAEITLPCEASSVEVLLAHSAQAPTVTAIDRAGDPVDRATMTTNGPELLKLTGKGIVGVHVDAASDETVLLRICWTCGDGPADKEPPGDRTHRETHDTHLVGSPGGLRHVVVRGSLGAVEVARATAAGHPGDVVKVQLTADAIDDITISHGSAVLIDLCVVPVGQGRRAGWKRVSGFRYPMCLPVAHPDYPCPGAPTAPSAAENLGTQRVQYGSPSAWTGSRFTDLHDRLVDLVIGGPGSTPMWSRSTSVVGTPAPPASSGGTITQQSQRPLDLLLLGSLDPAIAQILGMYWCDDTAAPGVAYDYLLVADHDGSLGGTAASGQAWATTVGDYSVNDGFMLFGLVVGPAADVPPPQDVQAFALPGATKQPASGGPVVDATNNAGVTWDRKQVGATLAPGSPVMYHLWRAQLGNVAVAPEPAVGDFDPLTKASPLPVTKAPPVSPQTPGDWPPFALPYIDTALPDGWYAYRTSAVDIFGRHSAHSVPAAWHQWAPAPTPKPWYYIDPAADRVIHASQIRLLDMLPPPPPTAVEAFALDPDDPTVVKDAAWQAWWASLSAAERTSVIGLRVRWRWGVSQQRQAPDTREFRIYYEPSPLNTLRGHVTSVLAAGAAQSDVLTDIAHTQPANSFVGVSVRIGAQSFRVVSSDAATPLRLRVQNIGPTDNIRPPVSRVAVPIPPGHALYQDFANEIMWQDRMLTVAYGSHVTVVAGGDRQYEVFLPVAASATRTGLPLVTTLGEPIAAAAIGVTAADDKTHAADPRGDPARYGNESTIGGPATVLRIRREPPPAPEVPADSAKLWASAADYHSRSYLTYRWQPLPSLKVFIYRALDDAVFQADRAMRPRAALQPTDAQYFPNEAIDPSWDLLKRQQVCAELNALNGLSPSAAPAAYRALSNDALRVLAGLPGVDRVYVQLNPVGIDPNEGDSGAPDGLRWRRVGADVAANSLSAGLRAYVDGLDGRASNRYFYRCAYVDEVHNLGPMSLASPPVWLPDVTPPTAPKVTKVIAGDCEITLEWSSNREPDLAEYRVYRTDDEKASRDIRLMALVHTTAMAVGDPAARPKTVTWTDDPVPGLRDLWYRIVAVDRIDADPKGLGGNVSDPSLAIRTRAYDQTPPEPPTVTSAEWVRIDPSGVVHAWADAVPPGVHWETGVRLAWVASDAMKVILQVQAASDAGFRVASEWLEPGTAGVLHRNARPDELVVYRLKAVSAAGNVNTTFHSVTVQPV